MQLVEIGLSSGLVASNAKPPPSSARIITLQYAPFFLLAGPIYGFFNP